MKLGIVTDIHHGRVTFTKQGPHALSLLADSLKSFANARVDAVVDLGDRISDVDTATDLALERDVGEVFEKAGLARHHVCGNHDRAHLTAAENADALAAAIGSRTVEIGGIRLVFWEPDVKLTRHKRFELVAGDLAWLEQTLAQSTQRTILFSHAPLSGHSMVGNYWFENSPDFATYREIDAIRAVLAKSPCPILALAGHVHWNTTAEVDGIRHLTLQSLSDSVFSHPEPSRACALLTIEGDRVDWNVSGTAPLDLSFRFPETKPERLPNLPPFSELKGDLFAVAEGAAD